MARGPWWPKTSMGSPRRESSTLARTASQKANELFSAETSLSLPAASGVSPTWGGGVASAALEQSSTFDFVICTTRWAKVICSGVGLKAYLSAGISSAAAIRFFSWRERISRSTVETGFFSWAKADIAKNTHSTRDIRFMRQPSGADRITPGKNSCQLGRAGSLPAMALAAKLRLDGIRFQSVIGNWKPAISGVAASRLRVYGSLGQVVISSVVPTSTSFPRYMTATRVAR